MAQSPAIPCFSSTASTDSSQDFCCPSNYYCLANSPTCISTTNSTISLLQQPCSSLSPHTSSSNVSWVYPFSNIGDSSSSNSSINPSWAYVFIWPIAIILLFAFCTLLFYLVRRHRKPRVPRNWHMSARTGEGDAELPSYADHWRSQRPWWISETQEEDDELAIQRAQMECDDPPPKYPDCPKYPEVVHLDEREGRTVV
jgi:hypothetical protein